MPWYIAKKKTQNRWTAYELPKKPVVKRGYEMKGPYETYVRCLIAANQRKEATQ